MPKSWGYVCTINGQVSAWGIYVDRGEVGLRYIPEMRIARPFREGRKLDAEISLNLYTFGPLNSIEEFHDNADAQLYRSYIRYSTTQYEVRLGLQKINFGPAKILRSLMWFDQLDIRDPLELTDGVYALLGRYFFLNNANIWLWALYGNDDLKGLETIETDEENMEFGGRCQFPAPYGEMALSFHHRKLDKSDWDNKMSRDIPDGDENRYAIDGSFDIGPGLWFEASASEIKIDESESLWNRFLTIGMDYTVDIGPGPHLIYEHFVKSTGPEIDEEDIRYRLSSLSADISLGILDTLNTIGYYDWEDNDFYYNLIWQRTYDNWLINLNLFSSPEDNDEIYSGSGILCTFAYNH